jgi:hypothetical protein
MPFPAKKKPGLTVAIAVGKPKSGLDAPDPVEGKPSAPEPDDSPETPGQDGGGGSESANPTAVGYRTEAETCQHCNYMDGDQCSHPMVAMQVSPGDSCAAFEAKEENGGQGESVENGAPGSESAEMAYGR